MVESVEKKGKQVKKRLALLMIGILCLSLTGCSGFKSYRLPGKDKKDIVDNELELVIDAIKNNDKQAIIDLFSDDALSQIDDMDDFERSIDELINTFPDWDGEYDGYNALKIREYAIMPMDHTSCYYYEPDIDFNMDGVDYEFHLVMAYHTDIKDQLGLSVIQINHEDVSSYKTEGYYCRPSHDTKPGVYCWDCKIE